MYGVTSPYTTRTKTFKKRSDVGMLLIGVQRYHPYIIILFYKKLLSMMISIYGKMRYNINSDQQYKGVATTGYKTYATKEMKLERTYKSKGDKSN